MNVNDRTNDNNTRLKDQVAIFRALVDGPFDAIVHTRLYEYYVEHGLTQVAEQIKHALSECLPAHGHAVVIVGIVNAMMVADLYEDCEALLRTSIGVKPEFETHKRLGELLRDQGQSSDAIVSFQAALALRPDDAGLCYEIAEQYFKNLDYHAAVDYYLKAAMLEPSLLLYYRKLNDLLLQQGEIAKAIACTKQILSCGSENQFIVFGLGKLLLDTGEYKEAENMFRSAIAFDDDVAMFHTHLAECYSRQGKVDSAIEYLRKILPRFSDKPSIYYQLAKNLMKNKRYDEAEVEILIAIEIDCSSSVFYRLAAECMRLQGKFDGACQLLRLAIKYDEHNPAHYFELSRCLKLAGDFLGADLLHDRAVMLSQS